MEVMPDELLTSAQAGDLLGKSARTVTRLAESGELTYSQKLPGPNGAYLFRRELIDAHLAAAAVDTINSQRGGKKLPSWWKTEAAS